MDLKFKNLHIFITGSAGDIGRYLLPTGCEMSPTKKKN